MGDFQYPSIRPLVSKAQVIDLVQQKYGFKVQSVQELNGYDDKNFKIMISGNENGYVLKVMNSMDSKNLQLVEGQNGIMLFLAERGFNVPHPIKNKNGQYYSIEKFIKSEINVPSHVVRLLKFVNGQVLDKATPTSKLYYNAGRLAAQIDNCLKSYHHNAYDKHDSIWMLKNAPLIHKNLGIINDGNKKQMVCNILKEFEERVIPKIPELESGMIHGDLNEHNLLVNGSEICGILDFGDSQIAPYVFEVSIALCYMIIHSKDLSVGKDFLRGYNEIRALSDLEWTLIKSCICTRMSQSVVLGACCLAQEPSNDYVATSQKNGWTMLESLSNINDEELIKMWKNV